MEDFSNFAMFYPGSENLLIGWARFKMRFVTRLLLYPTASEKLFYTK